MRQFRETVLVRGKMRSLFRISFFLLIVLLMSVKNANSTSCSKMEDCNSSVVTAFLPIILIESVIVAGSVLSAYEPMTGGGLGAYISIYHLMPNPKTDGTWPGFLSGISVSAHTMLQQNTSYSKSNLFLINFVGWHATFIIDDYFSRKKRNKYNLVIKPQILGVDDEVGLSLSMKF